MNRLDFSMIYWITIYRLKDRYRKTVAGFIWVILNPIIMYGVQAIVFKHLLKLDVPNYYVFLLSGLLPWIFITQCLETGTPLLESNASLLRSLKVPINTLVLSQVLDNFINFLFSSVIVVVVNIIFFNIDLSYFFLLPISIFFMLISISKMITIFSTLQVFFNDIKFILNFLLNILIFLTPIFYPVQRIPEAWRFLVNMNPFYVIIQHLRTIIYSFNAETYIYQLFYNLILIIILYGIDHFFISPKRERIPFVI